MAFGSVILFWYDYLIPSFQLYRTSNGRRCLFCSSLPRAMLISFYWPICTVEFKQSFWQTQSAIESFCKRNQFNTTFFVCVCVFFCSFYFRTTIHPSSFSIWMAFIVNAGNNFQLLIAIHCIKRSPFCKSLRSMCASSLHTQSCIHDAYKSKRKQERKKSKTSLGHRAIEHSHAYSIKRSPAA